MLRHSFLRLGLAFTGFAVTAFSLVGCVPADPPTVSSTDPASGETGTPLNTMISATFSEEMDPATITSQTFTLTTGATSVAGAVSYSGVTAIFNPSVDLLPDTRYTATIGTEASTKNLDARHNLDEGDGGWFALLVLGILASGQGGDQSLAGDYSWSFTTGPGVDVLAPTVASTSPADGSVGAVIGGNLSATFSESMDPATINVDTFTLANGQGPIAGSVAYSGVTATFNPTAALAPNTLFTATITTGAQDLAGNSLAADLVWTFTTGDTPDTTVPEVSATDPEDGAVDVPFDTLISATFSEAMNPLTISTASFTLADGTTPVAGSVTYTGLTATFTPTTELAPEIVYTATISMTAADLAGNTLAEDYVWTFTIEVASDTEAPTVVSTIPEDEATAVAVNSDLSATFSEAMDPTTISATSFTLSLGIVPILGTVTYADETATFNPTINLLPDSLYTATISTESTDAAGNALAEDFVWTFTTGAAGEGTAPVVSSTDPADGALDVATNTNLSATFSEAMNPFTVNPASFTLRQGTTPVLGTVVYGGVTAVFTPVADLAANEVYTATITMDAEDEAGNGLAEDYTWIFTTGDAPDITAPTVNSTDPGDGAQAVSVNKDLSVNFSEGMDPTTISDETFTLADGATPVAGTVTYVGVIAIFSPAAELDADTEYTATITTGAEDLAGSALAEDYVWTFTTGDAPDITAPVVSSTDPENGAIDTPVNTSLAANFSEAMAPLTITPASFTLRQDTTAVLGTVTYSGVTAVFNPVADLAPNTAYTATITAEATDLAGNALEADVEWSFTTGDAADITDPMVTFTDPEAGAVDVALNQNLAATFNEAMAPLTITTETFLLNDETGPVTGTVTYVGVIAVFNPAIDLEPNTLYTATITTGAEDLAGSGLAEDYVWTFTTGDAPDTTAPIVSFVGPLNGATDVPINSGLAANFSEAMAPLTITPTSFTLRQDTTPVLGTVTYSGVTAVFSPVAELAPNTVYTATITTEATDLAGNALEEDFEWSFTTGDAADITAPTVTFTDPADGATDVALNQNIAATFNEVMDPLTITTGTFVLDDETGPVVGTVTYVGVIAVFNPAIALDPNTLYTATITSGAEDLGGTAMATDYVWSFTTGDAADITAPIVSAVAPGNGAANVPVNQGTTVTFSEAMDPLTVTPATIELRQGTTPVLGTVFYSGVTAVFTPVADLLADTVYTATVRMEASDLAGNGLESDFEWFFTTGDTTDTIAPVVTATSPQDSEIDVAVNTNLSAAFNEAMNPFTISTDTFTLDNESGPVLGTVTYVGSIAIFDPTLDLAPNTLYTATITTGAEDLAGTALAADYVWTFTTGDAPDAIAPMVSFVDPVSGAIEVPTNMPMSITFSEEMDPLSITPATIDLRQGTTAVLGTATYSGVTAVFTPVANLEPDTIYTAGVRMEATDLAGNQLTEDFEWSFTTGIGADDVTPVVVSTTPEDAATNVPVNTSLAAAFSEAMNPATIDVLTFTLDDGVAPVLGAVSYGGSIAVFTPAAPLEIDTLYTATITTGVEDLVGNPLSVDFVWTFTTGASLDIVAPLVLSTDPIDGAIGVPINKSASVEFSEAMDHFTITTETFTLEDALGQIVGTVIYADGVATFAPLVNLATNTEYTATISMEAADLAGNTLIEDFTWVFTTGVTTAQQTLDFGTANAFAILAGSTVNNTGPTVITGDLGVSPGTAVTGFPPGILIGAIFTGVGSAAGEAKVDLTAAFNEAAGRSTGPVSLPGDLSGLTLFPGLYTNSTSVMLSAGNVTLDAQGDENAVFLFQMGSTLTTGSATQVILSGGANANNIYWQVGSSATLGTTSIFAGNILAETAITLSTGAVLNGRALTQSAAVSLDSATITAPTP